MTIPGCSDCMKLMERIASYKMNMPEDIQATAEKIIATLLRDGVALPKYEWEPQLVLNEDGTLADDLVWVRR